MIDLFFKNINGFAAFISLISLSLIYFAKPKYKYLFTIAALGLLILIESRAAILSFAIPLLFIFKKNKKLNVGFIFLFILGLFFFKTNSTNGRLLIWKITLTESKLTLLGNGINSFERDYPNLQKKKFEKYKNLANEEILADDARFAFNEFLQLYYEFGIIGLVIFFLIITFSLMTGFRLEKKLYSILFVSILINSLFYYTLHEHFLLSIFIFCCLRILFAKSKIKKKSTIYFKVLSIVMSAIPLFFWIYDLKRDKEIKEIEMSIFEGDYNFLNQNPPAVNNYYDKFRIVKLYAEGYLENKDTTKSIELIEKLKSEYQGYDVLIYLGKIYKQHKLYEKSIANFKDAKNTIPNRFEPIFELSQTYFLEGNYDSSQYYANELLTKKIKINSNRIEFFKDASKDLLQKINRYRN